MPEQNFTMNTKAGYAGDLYGLTFTNSQRNTYIASVGGTIEWGCAIKSTDNRTATAGINADGTINGVVIRALNVEQATRPGDGSVFYYEGTALAVLEEGYIQVDMSGAAVGGKVYVTSDGKFTTSSTDGTECTNASVFRAADSDGLTVLWIENHLAVKPEATA